MTAMANMGNLVVALPPSDIWLTDEQAANFLGYANTYFKASIICLRGFQNQDTLWKIQKAVDGI